MKKMRFIIGIENVRPEEEELFVQRFTLLTQELQEELGKKIYLDDVIEENNIIRGTMLKNIFKRLDDILTKICDEIRKRE